jgi:catechol 2,3-dioxygenase-like lactoylglutathione lyase family enzyme
VALFPEISMKVDAIDHLVLTVKDIDTTCLFYSRVLGMDVLIFGDGRKALSFGLQKINLHQYGNELEPKAHNVTPGSADLCFVTSVSLPEVITHVCNCGISLLEGPVPKTGARGPMTSIYFRDPDFNLIEVSNYEAEQGVRLAIQSLCARGGCVDIETRNSFIEEILSEWKDRIGDEYLGYRGHVYRMFNFCLALRPCTEEEKMKLAVAACFHDIGLWSEHTVDYIPPSVALVQQYLDRVGLQAWSEEVGLMVEMHHKVRAYKDARYPLVELFRKGDLVDFSLGFFSCGLSRSYINQVKEALPNHGFHKYLMKGAKEWFSRHPFSPPPFMKW